MCERSGMETISLGYCSVLSARKVCLKTVPIPLSTATVESHMPGWGARRSETGGAGSFPGTRGSTSG
jgi:hypothetical protein